MPQKKKRVVRITSNHRQKIKGYTYTEIMQQFQNEFSFHGFQNIRLYRLGTARERYFVKGINPLGQQFLYEVLRGREKKGVRFELRGNFNMSFTHREIYSRNLQGRGLGTHALKSYLALQRKSGQAHDTHVTTRKSTLRLFLSRGYRVVKIYPHREGDLFKGATTNEKIISLLKLLPERTGFSFEVQRTIRKQRNKKRKKHN